MKILIVVYDEGEWEKDTLEARMVDVRIRQMVKEFESNHVQIEVLRHKGIPQKWKSEFTEMDEEK